MPESRKILALVRDLMFSGKIIAEAKGAGVTCKVIREPKQLSTSENAEFLLVDLSQVDAIEAASNWKKASGKPIIGFAPHVEIDLLAQARAAGFDQVLTRGKFVAVLPQLIQTPLKEVKDEYPNQSS